MTRTSKAASGPTTADVEKVWIVVIAIIAGFVLLGGGAYVTYTHFKQRGIRNNNPGNLVKSAIAWKGKVPHAENRDSRFEQFRDFAGIPGHLWGLRAMFKDISGDIFRDGMDTVRKLITSYAPPHENDTAAYIAAISKAVGKGQDDRLTLADMPRLMAGIVKHENGINPYPMADIERAISIS